MNRLIFSVCLMFIAVTAQSEELDFVAQITFGGTHETDTRRMGVSVDGCKVSTWVEEPYQDQGWVLHSKFDFDLSWTKVVQLDKETGAYFYFEGNIGVVNFRTIAPYTAKHEMPNYRKVKRPSTPSDRQGADGYVFIENTDFVVLYFDVPTDEKPKAFADGLRMYREAFCLPTS